MAIIHFEALPSVATNRNNTAIIHFKVATYRNCTPDLNDSCFALKVDCCLVSNLQLIVCRILRGLCCRDSTM